MMMRAQQKKWVNWLRSHFCSVRVGLLTFRVTMSTPRDIIRSLEIQEEMQVQGVTVGGKIRLSHDANIKVMHQAPMLAL